jgi:uncharacterized hydrophobic protein (TIGR00271 family)
MSSIEHEPLPAHQQKRAGGFRDWFAKSLGVGQERKAEIYLEICESASLRDVSYWLQILFAAGIATLGLVLNSPAVIIGAMLISPLMGPILANGLALASGDIVLGARAILNLALSCLVAIGLAVLLVSLLPFKEVTSEIAARTRPNTLDLAIALFSGAIGSVAICKEVRGVVTSIPGVAIAVALMPPLCVVGYGLGVALSLNAAQGLQIASGGGLLFLTNLVAITFTAMLVFLSLHIDTKEVRERVREWRSCQKEGAWVRRLLARLPQYERLKVIGGLPARLLLIFTIIALILIPLSHSFSQLKREIAQKQRENAIRQEAAQIWQERYTRLESGDLRSDLGRFSIIDRDGKLTLQLRVFTSKPYTADEKAEYSRLVASRLNRPETSVALQLVEIPTSSGELVARAEEDAVEAAKAATPSAPETTIPQLQADLLQSVETSLRDLPFPRTVKLINSEVLTSAAEPLSVKLLYLGDREIDSDMRNLLVDDIKVRLNHPTAKVSIERMESSFGPLEYARNQTEANGDGTAVLDRAGQLLQQHPTWRVEIAAGADRRERRGIAEERARAITEYLSAKWQVMADRVTTKKGSASQRGIVLNILAG